jgi:membrane-associated protease RseP (regulator of RpoE activity)
MKKRFVIVAALLALGQPTLAANPQLGSGAQVDEVEADGAAASAGIQPGDFILAIDGKPINNYGDIEPVVAASRKPVLTVDIGRGTTRLRVKVTPHLSAQATGPRKLLGISQLGAAEVPKQRWSLVNAMFGPDSKSNPQSPSLARPQALAQPDRQRPNDLWHIFIEPPPEDSR